MKSQERFWTSCYSGEYCTSPSVIVGSGKGLPSSGFIFSPQKEVSKRESMSEWTDRIEVILKADNGYILNGHVYTRIDEGFEHAGGVGGYKFFISDVIGLSLDINPDTDCEDFEDIKLSDVRDWKQEILQEIAEQYVGVYDEDYIEHFSPEYYFSD